jgi:hypothetical protein
MSSAGFFPRCLPDGSPQGLGHRRLAARTGRAGHEGLRECDLRPDDKPDCQHWAGSGERVGEGEPDGRARGRVALRQRRLIVREEDAGAT